jgi:hypothetical protein
MIDNVEATLAATQRGREEDANSFLVALSTRTSFSSAQPSAVVALRCIRPGRTCNSKDVTPVLRE